MGDDPLQVVRDEAAGSVRALRQSGDAVGMVVAQLGGCAFSARTAGRCYAAEGAAVASGVRALTDVVTQWAHSDAAAADAIAGVLARLAATDEIIGARTGAVP
jgi:hypothetical protein